MTLDLLCNNNYSEMLDITSHTFAHGICGVLRFCVVLRYVHPVFWNDCKEKETIKVALSCGQRQKETMSEMELMETILGASLRSGLSVEGERQRKSFIQKMLSYNKWMSISGHCITGRANPISCAVDLR